MPHKIRKVDVDKPFKSFGEAANLLGNIADDWIESDQDRRQADLKMTVELSRFELKLMTTDKKKKR